MKQKFFTLLAAVLLGSISAFAQNTNPVKGDVNEDGTVDVADIVNVIKIMKEGGGAVGEKMCYWYAGTNNGNAVTADNFTDVSSRIAESEVPATGSVTANGQYVYFVMPENKHIESLTDGNGSAVEFTCTDVMGYHIYKTMDKINGKINYSVVQIVYYSYVGTDPNELIAYAETGELKEDISDNFPNIDGVKTYTSIPTSLEPGITINGGQDYVYVVAPTETLNNASVYLTNTSGGTIVTETLGTFSIGSTEYTVRCTPSEVSTVITAWK